MTLRALTFALVLSFGAAAPALACPLCGEANAADANRADAYQYSILFMLAMPALVFTGFAYGFYRLNKRDAAAEQAMLAGDESAPMQSGAST